MSPRPPVKFRTFEISDPRLECEGLRQVTLKSQALGQRVDISLYVCEGAERGARVPLVILLHGVYGSHWAWALKGGAHRTAARLCAAGAIPPMVLAMPSDGLWGDGSGYLAHRTQDFERWIRDEVPAAALLAAPSLGEHFPVCIAGLSMGGFGALRLAAKHPRYFLAASGHSSATHLEQLRDYVEEPLATFTALEEDRSVLDTFLRQKDAVPKIRFDCGTDDPLLEANRTLHLGLERAGIPHLYEEFPGGHDWRYWEKHLERTLLFFAAAL
ncbi:MAG: S-formylglutathione hydrolase FrmB [Verrucomicrobia bacterium]|nr:MAG: S-formylglutathione hydrolase FrmB [Verrucomicrobiota bacterium]